MEDRILDITPYLGKVVLVGVSFCDAEGNQIERIQFWGTVMRLSEHGWIEIATEGKSRFGDGEFLEIPPVLEAANPGAYRLHLTGETLMDPTSHARGRSIHRLKRKVAALRGLFAAVSRRGRGRFGCDGHHMAFYPNLTHFSARNSLPLRCKRNGTTA